MSVADKADFVRRVFVRYGVLVDFEGDVPPRLAQGLNAKAAAKETLGEFCVRVLGKAHNQVTVFPARSLPGRTLLASVEVGAEHKGLAKALKPVLAQPSAKAKPRVAKPSATEVEAVKEVASLKRRLAKLEKQLQRAESDAERLRKSRQRQAYSPKSIDALVAKLEAYLESKVPVHELVAARVKVAVARLGEDVPLCDAVWPLVEMADAMVQLERKKEDEINHLRALLDRPLPNAA